MMTRARLVITTTAHSIRHRPVSGLPPWIIEELKKGRRDDQPCVELPLPVEEPPEPKPAVVDYGDDED